MGKIDVVFSCFQDDYNAVKALEILEKWEDTEWFFTTIKLTQGDAVPLGSVFIFTYPEDNLFFNGQVTIAGHLLYHLLTSKEDVKEATPFLIGVPQGFNNDLAFSVKTAANQYLCWFHRRNGKGLPQGKPPLSIDRPDMSEWLEAAHGILEAWGLRKPE